IKLNVGGQYFTTSLQTLTKDKGSMLHAMGTSNHNGILCNGSFGPIFGGGHDLLISNEPNANSDSTTKLGHTYQCPDDANSSFLTGLSDFVVNELEVFMYQP
ncbi:unnamed protein product, partial [Porites lobata]